MPRSVCTPRTSPNPCSIGTMEARLEQRRQEKGEPKTLRATLQVQRTVLGPWKHERSWTWNGSEGTEDWLTKNNQHPLSDTSNPSSKSFFPWWLSFQNTWWLARKHKETMEWKWISEQPTNYDRKLSSPYLTRAKQRLVSLLGQVGRGRVGSQCWQTSAISEAISTLMV